MSTRNHDLRQATDAAVSRRTPSIYGAGTRVPGTACAIRLRGRVEVPRDGEGESPYHAPYPAGHSVRCCPACRPGSDTQGAAFQKASKVFPEALRRPHIRGFSLRFASTRKAGWQRVMERPSSCGRLCGQSRPS
jgi:hypothetical protein